MRDNSCRFRWNGDDHSNCPRCGGTNIDPVPIYRGAPLIPVGYDYEHPHPDPHPENFWHIYETGMDGDDDAVVTIKAPDTPEMHAAIIRIVEAINDAYEMARRLRGDE